MDFLNAPAAQFSLLDNDEISKHPFYTIQFNEQWHKTASGTKNEKYKWTHTGTHKRFSVCE